MPREPLKFIVAPHIVQDLGLNLYTSLPRVLVEFVANAYDADSKIAKIQMNRDKIADARNILKKQWELEKAQNTHFPSRVKPLAERTLPEDIEIIIEDLGHGMSRDDMQNKFLVAGRRRRNDENRSRTDGGRIIMGRKGLGKLAGFGVAQVVTVISRAKGEKTATKITLNYNELIKQRSASEVPITETQLQDGGGIKENGTIIILSHLLYEPMKSRLETVEHAVADHFALIDPKDFCIKINSDVIKPTPRVHVYGWPNPDVPINQLIEKEYQVDDGRKFTFQYRLRFTEDRSALIGKERGVRVYAHKRLAAAPSLLDADTNMHGFRMTDYLDGVVHADFIDDQPEDYIATDRQALRWESPLLAPMYDFLSAEIKEACYSRQKARDQEKVIEVKEDEFTIKTIEKADLTKKEKTVAFKIASAISSLHKKGLEDDDYKTQFSQVIRGMGQGEILSGLAKLASQDIPAIDSLLSEIARLNAEEIDGFYQFVKGRINGIKAFKKVVKDVNFKNSKKEKIVQRMFEGSPWMIDPTYTQFLSADQSMDTLFDRLAKELQIGSHASDDSESNEKRPDLVFLIGSRSLQRLVIVELYWSRLKNPVFSIRNILCPINTT